MMFRQGTNREAIPYFDKAAALMDATAQCRDDDDLLQALATRTPCSGRRG